jgi:hypothetical protein
MNKVRIRFFGFFIDLVGCKNMEIEFEGIMNLEERIRSKNKKIK